MNTKEIDDAAFAKFPFTFRNNRGIFSKTYVDKVGKSHKHYVRCGIPEPKGNESDEDLKGGDRIGWTLTEITPDMVGCKLAIFTSIEIKGPGDKLHPGQIAWHNLVLRHGGISEVWTTDNIIKERIDE